MLLSKNDIPKQVLETTDADDFSDLRPIQVEGESHTYLSPKTQKLGDAFGLIEREQTYHIATRGAWSSPHLMEHLLNQIGPAECYLTSWSVKEQAVRILMMLMDSGKITSLHCLFDERIRVQCPQAYQLAEHNIADIRLTKIHAKQVILINADWHVSITTSANLTRNPRIERFVISTHKSVALFDRDWIRKEIDQANPFEL